MVVLNQHAGAIAAAVEDQFLERTGVHHIVLDDHIAQALGHDSIIGRPVFLPTEARAPLVVLVIEPCDHGVAGDRHATGAFEHDVGAAILAGTVPDGTTAAVDHVAGDARVANAADDEVGYNRLCGCGREEDCLLYTTHAAAALTRVAR